MYYLYIYTRIKAKNGPKPTPIRPKQQHKNMITYKKIKIFLLILIHLMTHHNQPPNLPRHPQDDIRRLAPLMRRFGTQNTAKQAETYW